MIVKLATKNGTDFYTLRPRHEGPAPTLLLFAMGGEDTLTTEPYCRSGRYLSDVGWCIVSLDLPCHADDAPLDEDNGLVCWATRIKSGEDIVGEFQARVNEVVSHLIDAGMSDPNRIAAQGTSRGGFMAFHAAIGNPRIRAVAAIAPVTDLRALREFEGLDDNSLVKRLALIEHSEALADRATWIVIGSTDDRVDTALSIAVSQSIVREAVRQDKDPQVTLQVVPTPGHYSLPDWYDDAARWLELQCPVDSRAGS